MPELPEVETIAQSLRQGGCAGLPVLGHRIRQAEVRWVGSIAQPDAGGFARQIEGQTFEEIKRRGKFLHCRLSVDHLLIHLRMSGDLRVEAADSQSALLKHDHVVLRFEDGTRLVFNDARKFGRLWLTANPADLLAGLGPEPFDEGLNAEVFHAMLERRQRQIKPLLLDQKFIAGMGNIYTDEALYLAKLHPLTRANQLTMAQALQLFAAIRKVLTDGIHANGASIDWVYRGGRFQHQFNVYQRNGQACHSCGTAIARLTVGQRGTHICPQCQPFQEG